MNDQSPVTPGTPFLRISLSREDQRKLCSSGSGWRQCEGKGKFHPVPSTCPPTSFLFNTLGPIQTGKAGLASSAGPGLTAIPPSKGPEVTGPGLPWSPNCTCSPNCALTSARPQSYGASRFLDGTVQCLPAEFCVSIHSRLWAFPIGCLTNIIFKVSSFK